MAAIETHELRKVFGGSVVAIDGLDLRVEEGEVYGFLGPNGAGKTTTINLLLNFMHPTSGEARILGYDSRSESMKVRENIGILPEGASLYDRLTGREHIELAKDIKGADDDADELLDRVGLSAEDRDRAAGKYSKGMSQRLGLGMALVGDPDLLILDEPSSGLDPTGMSEMRELIREEADDGTAVFFSSHILGEVEAVCDRIGILDDGELVAQDSIAELREQFAGECTVEITVESVPQNGFDLERSDGIVDVNRTENTLTVTCEDPSVRSDVIQHVGDRSVITNVIAEETSLEDMFEEYTDGTSDGENERRDDAGIVSKVMP